MQIDLDAIAAQHDDHRTRGRPASITSLAFDAAGARLAVSIGEAVVVYDVVIGALLFEVRALPSARRADDERFFAGRAAFTSDGRRLAVAFGSTRQDFDNDRAKGLLCSQLHVFEASSGSPVGAYVNEHHLGPGVVAWTLSPDGSRLATVEDAAQSVLVWDLTGAPADDSLRYEIYAALDTDNRDLPTNVAFDLAGDRLAVAAWGWLKVYALPPRRTWPWTHASMGRFVLEVLGRPEEPVPQYDHPRVVGSTPDDFAAVLGFDGARGRVVYLGNELAGGGATIATASIRPPAVACMPYQKPRGYRPVHVEDVGSPRGSVIFAPTWESRAKDNSEDGPLLRLDLATGTLRTIRRSGGRPRTIAGPVAISPMGDRVARADGTRVTLTRLRRRRPDVDQPRSA